MIKLNQHESNIFYWSKGWYNGKTYQNFWPQLKTLCDHYYGMDGDTEDIYSVVRKFWRKIIDALPNKDRLIDEYENETLPYKARYYFGSPNFANRNWHCDDSFNAEQIIKARVAVMISQIGSSLVAYYETVMPEDIGDLKVENREKLEEMMKTCQNP